LTSSSLSYDSRNGWVSRHWPVSPGPA
jgi:hypothetical protein